MSTREERCRLANQAAMHLNARPQFFIADNSLWLMWNGSESNLPVVRKRKVRICGYHFDWHHRQPWGGNQGAALVHLAQWIRTGKMTLTVEYWERWCGPPARLGNDEFLRAIKEYVYGGAR